MVIKFLNDLKEYYFSDKSIYTLRYSKKEEEIAYQKSVSSIKFTQGRYAAFITSFFYVALVIIDFFTTTPDQFIMAVAFHGYMSSILFSIFFISFFKPNQKYIIVMLAFASISAVVGNSYLQYTDLIIYQPSVYLVLIWIFIMSGFSLYLANMLNISLISFIIIFSLLTHKDISANELTNYLYILIAYLIGLFALYNLEFTSRKNFEDTKKIEKQNILIAEIHKHTEDSIEYASLIQGALIPENELFKNYFQDYFALWHPKDIVGGDVYLFEELRDKDECLLMVIDCTGHGVPGAFVTMLVKAIERQIVAKIENDRNIEVSPAWILAYFNKQMKILLKQHNADSISNAGFDGGIIYYNKKDKILKFAGAETPLFYVEDEELKTIKGDRYSVGYKKCDMNYEYKEHIIDIKEGMQFYLTTDGYLDQNGGEKSLPFGKKRFKAIIEENRQKSMANQQEICLNTLAEYQGDEERNDDVTLVGFKI